ncbi:MAG TPA: zf-HC2 domain-containing protein [Burkholderiales bacterium]|jgi:Putative zinc-finger|nr:zf-HC2 domain-containing protein [Burkholderiales bacterium]
MAQPLRITCKEASRLLSQAMDQELPLWERARLRLHLAVCDACTTFSRQLRLLRRALGRLLD